MFFQIVLLAGMQQACLGQPRENNMSAPAPDRGDFGPFVRSLNIKPHGYSIVSGRPVNAPARLVERFEVRPGDCHFNKGYNDCRHDRERSELSERGDRNPRGSEAWYGWDFFLGRDWPDIWPAKTVLGQFHQKGSHPLWMFLNYKGALVLDDHVGGHSRAKTELVPADSLKGKWHRIRVHARWEKDDRGFFSVTVDGKLKYAMQGPTMTAELVYFKYGVYRAFVSRYKKAAGEMQTPAQKAFFANVFRSRTGKKTAP